MALLTHVFLRERGDEIVRAWEEELAAAPRDVALAQPALRDSIPDLLDELAGWLADPAAPPPSARLRAVAARHAVHRAADAYQLRQLIDEFRVLRRTILRLLLSAEASQQAGEGASEVPGRIVALARLNDGLDFAIGGVVEEFVAERDRRITALRGADATLHEREIFLRRVLDATPSMVFVKDEAGRFVLGNAALARVYGTTVQALVGKTDADFNASAEQVAAFLRDDREVIRTRRQKLIPEEPVSSADGRSRWFATVKVPLVEEDGSCHQVLGVATDITERKRAEEALRESDRRKDEFLAMLAHELRNPLAAIASAAHLIGARLGMGKSVERPLEILERQVRNSARLLDDLLDVSRMTRGMLHLEKERIRLDAVIHAAVDSKRSAIDAAGHRLSITLPHEPVTLDADATRLEQVLSNLLDNAAKYTPPGGEISLAVTSAPGEVVIRVRDTGAGIPPALLPRVFDLFVQEQQSLARSKGGLGLGLTIVRKLVEMHDGTVMARSDGPGKGSEFVVRLPAQDGGRERAGEPRAARAPAHRPPTRVLIVEDNLDVAEMLAEQVGSLGHDVTVVHDGPAAVAAAVRVRPDVVLLDIGLPGMDGYEVARRLRADARTGHPVLIALTGYGQDEDRDRSRDAGFAHHLTKPVEPAVLERLVAEGAAVG